MAFGLGDLADWIRDLIDEGSNAVNVVKGDAPLTNIQSVNQNVEQGIIDPGKTLAEFSGLTQGYRGARPNASNMDKGLALLALMGALSGGAGDDVVKGGKKAIDVLDDLRPSRNRIYGVHMSPTSGLKSIDISKGMKKGTAKQNWYDSIDDANYFFNMDNASETKLRQMKTYLDAFGRGKNSSMSAYLVRVPRKGAFTDVNDMYLGEESLRQKLAYLFDEAATNKGIVYLDGQMYTKKPLKVLKEIKLKQGDSRMISSKKLSDAVMKFNSKNPNSNKMNKSVIDKWGRKMLEQEMQDRADHILNFGKYRK
jgi:hypothetical protein